MSRIFKGDRPDVCGDGDLDATGGGDFGGVGLKGIRKEIARLGRDKTDDAMGNGQGEGDFEDTVAERGSDEGGADEGGGNHIK